MTNALALLARHGRWVLVAGLLAGIAVPPLARAMAAAIVPLIAVMLFLAALRTGPAHAVPPRRLWPRTVLTVVLVQTALPLLAAAALAAAGLLGHPIAVGSVLVLAAAPITGAPGLALMCGADAGVAMRQLALGTALLPLTALPVFLILPVFHEADAVLWSTVRLLALIAAATGLAAFLRRWLPGLAGPAAAGATDGLVALVMGLLVVGLMSAIGPALLRLDPALGLALLVAFGLHFGLAAGTWREARRRIAPRAAAGLAIAMSNRNLALFLTGLPPETVAELLIFVGCYQIPMYLTPLVLPRVFGGALS